MVCRRALFFLYLPHRECLTLQTRLVQAFARVKNTKNKSVMQDVGIQASFSGCPVTSDCLL